MDRGRYAGYAGAIAHGLNVRDLAGLVRWLRWTARYRNLRTGLFFCGRGSSLLIRPDATLQIGSGFVALDNFNAVWSGSVTIGDNVFFNEGCHVSVTDRLEVGDGCLFGEKVSIHDENHCFGTEYSDVPLPERGVRSTPVIIEDNVWVGAKCTILAGAKIGHGAVIGAHSIVIGEIPPRSLALGTPARVIRTW